MRAILSDSYARVRRGAVSGGVWYSTDYFKACGGAGIADFVEKGRSFHGYAPEHLFSQVHDAQSESGFRIYSFAVRRGVKPSFALREMQRGLSILDCGSVCNLAIGLALSDYLGEERFDLLFDPAGRLPYDLTGDERSILSLVMPRVEIGCEGEIQRGDVAYFGNAVEYVAKHPAEEARGFNVLCCDEGPHRYLGFGLSPEGCERIDVERNLWEGFNEDPIGEGFFPEYLWKEIYAKSILCDEGKSRAFVASLRNKKMRWEEYRRDPGRLRRLGLPCEGKLALCVYRPDVGFIERLKNSPKESVFGALAASTLLGS